MLIAVLFLIRRRPSARVVGGAGGYGGAQDMTGEITVADVLATLTVRESLSLIPGQPFDISESLVRLGRGADNDIVVPDAPVSRNHAEIHVEGDKFRVIDLGSTYGTIINGQKVGSMGGALKDGDELALGTRTTMLFTVIQRQIASSDAVTMDIEAGGPNINPTLKLSDLTEPLDEVEQETPAEEAPTIPLDNNNQWCGY